MCNIILFSMLFNLIYSNTFDILVQQTTAVRSGQENWTWSRANLTFRFSSRSPCFITAHMSRRAEEENHFCLWKWATEMWNSKHFWSRSSHCLPCSQAMTSERGLYKSACAQSQAASKQLHKLKISLWWKTLQNVMDRLLRDKKTGELVAWTLLLYLSSQVRITCFVWHFLMSV